MTSIAFPIREDILWRLFARCRTRLQGKVFGQYRMEESRTLRCTGHAVISQRYIVIRPNFNRGSPRDPLTVEAGRLAKNRAAFVTDE